MLVLMCPLQMLEEFLEREERSSSKLVPSICAVAETEVAWKRGPRSLPILVSPVPGKSTSTTVKPFCTMVAMASGAIFQEGFAPAAPGKPPYGVS